MARLLSKKMLRFANQNTGNMREQLQLYQKATTLLEVDNAIRFDVPIHAQHPFFTDFSDVRGDFEDRMVYKVNQDVLVSLQNWFAARVKEVNKSIKKEGGFEMKIKAETPSLLSFLGIAAKLKAKPNSTATTPKTSPTSQSPLPASRAALGGAGTGCAAVCAVSAVLGAGAGGDGRLGWIALEGGGNEKASSYVITLTKKSRSMSSGEVINLISSFSIGEQLMIVEAILKHIREEQAVSGISEANEEVRTRPAILNLAGIMDEAEAEVMTSAVEESRKIDRDEW